MKPLLLVAVLAGCSSRGSEPKPPAAPPVPVATMTVGCGDAAAGLERGTRSIRPPDVTVLDTMRVRCTEDAWPAIAIHCFAAMREGDLGRCAGELAQASRERLFATLGGGFDDHTAIVVAQARLSSLKVGIAECDRFVVTVSRALDCHQMPLDQRAQLGNETADFWSLPTTNLPASAARRMADVCGKSLTFLQQQVADAGCMP